MSFTITVDIGDFTAQFRATTEQMIDAGQRTLTIEAKKAADVYTPLQEGNLRDNFEYTLNERGIPDGWTYRAPYAWRQWNGLTKDGRPFNYSKDRNREACSRWGERGAVDMAEDIAKAVREALLQ